MRSSEEDHLARRAALREHEAAASLSALAALEQETSTGSLEDEPPAGTLSPPPQRSRLPSIPSASPVNLYPVGVRANVVTHK